MYIMVYSLPSANVFGVYGVKEIVTVTIITAEMSKKFKMLKTFRKCTNMFSCTSRVGI